MKTDLKGRIVGWDQTYQRAACNVKWDKGETPEAVRIRWGVITYVDDSLPIVMLHVKDIHNGDEGLLFHFEPHTVMPECYCV